MKRRSFIVAASSVAVGLPVAYYVNKQKRLSNPLTTPSLLISFCDEKALKEIGNSYRKLVQEENEKQKLTDIILTDKNGVKINATDKGRIEKTIIKKVHEDFLSGDTVIIKGWLISKTEARQCALFSFS